MGETCDLHGNPGADDNELKNLRKGKIIHLMKQKDVSASNIVTQIGLHATRKSPITKKRLQGKFFLDQQNHPFSRPS
jgi:hypothetical protein